MARNGTLSTSGVSALRSATASSFTSSQVEYWVFKMSMQSSSACTDLSDSKLSGLMFELGGPVGYSCNSFSITGCRILLTKFHLQLAHQFRELARSAQQGRRKGHKFGVLLVGTPKPEFNKMRYQVLPPDP